jgi:hypothetical protein
MDDSGGPVEGWDRVNMRTAFATFALLVVCAFASGCRSVPTIWRAESRSPDGTWLATAHTEQDGGFGSASIMTSVDLKRVNGTVNSGKPTNVLSFDCPGPAGRAYILDNNANAGGTIDLKMKWLTRSHLEVTYDGKAQVVFQVVKFADAQISLRDTSSEPGTVSQ